MLSGKYDGLDRYGQDRQDSVQPFVELSKIHDKRRRKDKYRSKDKHPLRPNRDNSQGQWRRHTSQATEAHF